MVNKCNNAGVMVVADLVINHMSGHGSSGTGTGGSSFNGGSLDYPGVPFSSWDFHQPYCEINNYQNVDEVRNCYLVALNDLDGGKDYVRGKIADYINDMINIGVKGFRVDASKHMWPGDLEAIQGRLSGDPFVFHEVNFTRFGRNNLNFHFDRLLTMAVNPFQPQNITGSAK